jgi:hypothetical protein
MTIYHALRLLNSDRKLYFTDLKVDGRFDNERAMNSERSSTVIDPSGMDEGFVFNTGLFYKNIVILDKDGSVVAKDAFTPSPKEREECARYHVCSFWDFGDNGDIPFVRRRKPKDFLGKIADRIDEYIVRNSLRLNDPDEDEDGQCVSSFMLADALKDDPVLSARAEKMTRRELRKLTGMFLERTIWIDEEANEEYGEVFILDPVRTEEGVRIDIWDGWPK